MAFTYTPNVPQATQTIAFTQPLIQANFQYLQPTIGIDHNFSLNSATATNGYHKDIHIIPQADPVAIAGISQLYAKTILGDTQLFHMTGGGGKSQLTGYSNLVNGFQHIGGVAIQWGIVPLVPSFSSADVNFPNTTLFTANAYVVLPTLISATGGIGATTAFVSIVSGSITNTKFKYSYADLSAGEFVGFYWLAVGPAV